MKRETCEAVWCLALSVPAAHSDRFAEAINPFVNSVAIGAPDPQGRSRVEAIAMADPDRAGMLAALALLSASLGIAEPPVEINPLAPADWLMISRQTFAPIRIGRFFIRGSDSRDRLPDGCIGLVIDSGMAFGTGRHESTQGCLLTLLQLARARRFARVLDLGCGCGTLGIAAARLWNCRVTASDIDGEAVGVAEATIRRNALAARIRTVWSDGPSRRWIKRNAPFDLIAANIVPMPLLRLSRTLVRALAPGGVIILGGMIVAEATPVERRYRALGLHLMARIDVAAWRTLVFMRPGRRTSRLVPPVRRS